MDNDTTEIELPEGAHRLPSGGWVMLSDENAATGKDVHNLRKALDKEGTGTIGNALLAEAIGQRVIRWEIPGRPNLPLPRGNTTWLSLLGWEDTLAIEELVEGWAKRVALGRKPADDGQPGGPPAPDSE
jgi:hypothetical protein